MNFIDYYNSRKKEEKPTTFTGFVNNSRLKEYETAKQEAIDRYVAEQSKNMSHTADMNQRAEQRVSKAKQYENLKNNSDFAENSINKLGKGQTFDEVSRAWQNSQITPYGDDQFIGADKKIYHISELQDYQDKNKYEINDKLTTYLDAVESGENVNSLQEDGKDTWGSLMYEGEQKRWSYLNDDEKKNYYYLYNTQGKNAAYQYLTDMEYDLGMRENTEQQEKLKDAKWYEEILYNVASIPANVYGGAIAAIGDVSNIIQGKEINPYSTSHRAMNFAQNVRTDTAEKLQVTDSEIANQIFANTYQAVMSSLDSALGAATLGNGYTVAMGMGAASQRASEMWQNGATQEQIVGGAIASGLIEWWTEKYSFDQITDGLWKNAVSTGDILKAIGMGALVEGFEEVHADALNLAADALIMGANSNHESRVRELMAQGMSEGQARNQATKEAALDMFWSFYGGFVSGGLFSVEQGVVKGNEIKGNISKYNQSYSGNNADLITEGKELGNNYAKKFDANKDLSSGQRAKIIQGNTRIIQQNDAQSINMAVKSRLESLGVKDNLNEMAGYITKSYVNQFGGDQYLNIESSEKKAFNNNKIAQQVKNELFNATTKNFNDTSSRWTGQADTTYTTPDAFDTQRELQSKENEIISKSIGVDTNAVKTLAQQENISEDEAYIRQASKDLNINPALVGSLVKGYDSSKLSAGKYILGMQEAIRYGEYGYSLSALPKNSFTKNLSNSQLSMGYNLGKALSNDSVAKAQENTKQVSKKAKISYHPSVNQKNLTKDQKAQIKVLTQINKDSAKAEIVLFASKDGKLTQDMFGRKAGDVAPNGAYYNGKIYIDVNAGNSNAGLILNTGSHEYVHYIASNDYKGFVDLAHALADVMEKKGFNVDQYVRTKAEKQNISYRAAYEEWVADSMQSLLTDVDVIEKLETIKANNKNAWEKIKDFFLKIFEQLKEFFNSNFAVESLEGQMVQGLKNESLEDYQKIADYFTKGLVDSGKQSADDGSIAFSLRENENITNRSISYYEDNKKGSASHISQETFNEANDNVNKMVKYMSPYLDLTNNNGRRYLPEEILGKTTFSNGSYGKTIENTTICFRTLSYIDFTNEIKKKIGRPLTVEESFLASQMLYDIAKEPQCLYCYVSLDRKSYDGFLLQYIEQRDETIKKFIALEDKSKANIDNLYNEFLNGRKPTPQMRNRFNLWINSVINGKELIKLSDLTTEEIRASLKQGELADQINDAERYAQGASWAKKLEQYRSYNSDLLRMSQKMVNKLNAHYGLRFYSFSEYTPAFIVENMQQIRDASLKGLYGLAYTKKPDFARVFANTGMNINISVFGKMEDGKVIPDTRQGAEWEEVQELRKQFKNVGAVFVATSDELTEWALAQDWIDVVIPFHIVRTGANVAEFYKWTNNTAFQADKDGAGKNKTISPAEHHNDLATFKRLVEERGLTPRFEKFKDNPNYMKLVNETRLSDLESKKLTPIFDLNAAKKSFDTFVEDGGYYGNWYNEGINYKDAVDIVAEDVLAGKRANEVKYGRQDEKVEYDINELIKRHKTRNKPNNRVHGQALLSDRDDAGSNLGYHAGDLGKSQVDDYWKQGYSRNSGHFGFGTYFVGNESQINDGIYGERKHESVDFSKYNLYKPSSSEKAYKLHDALRVIDGYIEVYSKYANQSKDDFDEWKNDLRDAALNLRDESFDDFDDDDSFIEGIMSRKTLDEFYDEYLSDYEKSQVESQTEKIHKKLNDSNYTIDLIRYQEIAKYIDSAIAEEEWLWGKLNKLNDDLYSALEGKVSKADIGEALKKTENVVATYERNVRGYDSAATVFMKALGYEGVDVRGTSLDNTGYGSVIYDLKGEDLARKKEIGTARFSDRDSQGNTLTKEQQEYFKDSKVRDEDGNLLVVYHGTLNGRFNVFTGGEYNDSSALNWFTPSKDYASVYAGDIVEQGIENDNDGEYIYQGYLNAKNVLDFGNIDVAGTTYEDGKMKPTSELKRLASILGTDVNTLIKQGENAIRYEPYEDNPIYVFTGADGFDKILLKAGYDAIKVMENDEIAFGIPNGNSFKETTNKNPSSNPDIRYSIRYESTADEIDKQNLDIAKEMDKKKTPMENIRLATGWYKQSDKKWRNEFSDFDAKIILPNTMFAEKSRREKLENFVDKLYQLREQRNNALLQEKDYYAAREYDKKLSSKLKEFEKAKRDFASLSKSIEPQTFSLDKVLDFKELYKYYPSLKDTQVTFTYIKGAYGVKYIGENKIEISNLLTKEETLETLLHEVQHSIQEIEKVPLDRNKSYEQQRMEIEAHDVGARHKMSDAERQANAPVKFSDRVLMGSLFSGGGTLEAGLVYQMLDKQFAVEFNKKIASVYMDNFGKEHTFVGDVQDFDSTVKGKNVFYLHASPVCKRYSTANLNKNIDTILDIVTAKATARVIKEQNPKVFTLENVPRYLNSKAYNIITDRLNELGYTFDVQVYNASDYGNATKRERLILRAVAKGLTLPNKPAKVTSIKYWDELTRNMWDSLPNYTIPNYLMERIRRTQGLREYVGKDGKINVPRPILLVQTNANGQDELGKGSYSYCYEGELCPTLTTHINQGILLLPNGVVKRPTPQFFGKIQGLPDNYKYPKAITTGYTIVGNGIPTQLTKAVMGGVLDSVYEQTHDGDILFSNRDKEYLDLAKNPEKNETRLREMVDAAARENGYKPVIRYHQTSNRFNTFRNDNPVAALHDSETPNGYFFKDNNHDIGVGVDPADFVKTGKGGNVQMEVFLKADNMLTFKDRKDAAQWYSENINGYKELFDEYQKSREDFNRFSNDNTALLFEELKEVISQNDTNLELSIMKKYENILDAYLKKTEPKKTELREKMRNLLNKYFLNGNSQYDGIELAYDGHRYIDGVRENVHTYIVFNPNQIKSADLVTYDNDGNIIPLSERFNSNVDDIRFSERGNGYDGYSMSNNARTAYANGEMPLSKWNKEAIIQGVNEINPDINVDGLTLPTLRERFLRQSSWHHTSMYYNKTDFYSLNKGFIEGLTQADVDNIKPVVVSRVQRDASVDSMVEDAYNKIQILVASGKYATESSAATRLLQGANIDSLYQAALENIKAKDKAKVDQWRRLPADHYRAEYVNLYDNDIEAYAQKEYGGKTLSKNSTMFKRMQNYYLTNFSDRGESFDPRTVLSNALTDTAQNEKEKQLLAQYKQGIELINKKEKELKQVKKKIHDIMFTKGSDRSGLADLQARSKALENDINRYDKKLLTLQSTQALKDVFVRERDKYIKQGREQAKNVYVGYLERAEKTALKSKIKLIREDLVSRFTDKRENRNYVPSALAAEVIDICNMIDPTGERQNTKVAEKYRTTKTMLNELRSRYDELKGFEDYDFSSEFSEEFSSLINQLAKEIGDVPVRNMSPEQLEDVLNILSDIRYMLRDATKQIGKAEAITNYQAGQEIIDNMEMLKAKGITNSAIMEFTRNWTTNPMRAVREMTGYIPDARLNVLFEDLNVGRRKADSFKMDVTKKFQSLIDTNKQAYVDMIEKPVTLNNVKDINGNPLRITKAQAMSYLLTWERENVNEKRNHLDGGAAFLNPDYLIKGNYAKARDTAQVIGAVTQDIIAELSSIMNDFDKAYMDLTREFFRETSTKAVNETTLLTKHRIVAEEKNYFPYSVDSNFIATENENVQYNATIEGMGMLKSVKPYASQQLIMDNVNTIIDRHLNKVATLYGLAVPVRNINKALNMKQTFEDGGNSVKNAISNTWGSRAIDNNSVILKAIADVQSPRRSNNVSMFAFAKGVMVQTTLNANISVWLKQFASYPTAGAYLSANSLAKGLSYFGKTKQLFNEIDEHTSQHYIRRLGLSTIELGDINLTQGWQNKLNKKLGKMSPMNWIQAMDVATTAMLWVACKEEIKSSGINEHSKEYWEEVTKLYDKVVEDTQPMYDPLHRAEVTKADGLKNLIMFQTQPIQNSGIIREAFVGLKTAKKMYGTDSSEYESAKKVMAKSIASQLASHLTFTIFTAIAGVVLHKMKPYKDDDGELTPESFFAEFIKKFGYNVFSAFVPVVGSMITSLIDNISNGTNYDILTDATVDKINSTINTFRKTFTNPNLNNFKSLAIEILSYLGIPAGNVYNIVNGLILNAKDIINGEPFSFKAE